MELYYEDNLKKKNSKIPMIIGVSIILLVLIMILIIYFIIYLRGTVLSITLDGQNAASYLEELFYFQETETGTKLYIPIRAIAEYLGYEDYRGDYNIKSEDENKCYIQNEYETTMYTVDSNKIIKTRGNSDYEYVELDENVVKINGELYTTIDGIKKGFNVEFLYDTENKNIEIYTMDYLITYYTTALEIEEYSTEFTDKKAIFENMIVIINNDQYGVIQASTGTSILETKYDSITYLPATNDFLVESSDKYGVLSSDATTKVKLVYDELTIMDNENGLYLVKQNNLYGVIDTEGNVIISPEYTKIGLDSISNFTQNGIENKYVILDELIPIKNDSLWAIFNIEGEQLTEFKYTGIGCTTSAVSSSYPVLTVPSYKLLVVQVDKLYNLLQTDGVELINSYVLDSVYLRTDSTTGVNSFYMTYNGNTRNIEDFLSSIE